MPTAPLPRARTYGPTAPVKLKHAGPPPAEVDAPGPRDAVTASAHRSEALLASQHSASAVAPTQRAMRDPAFLRSDRSPTPARTWQARLVAAPVRVSVPRSMP
jgi:hypothetical protein